MMKSIARRAAPSGTVLLQALLLCLSVSAYLSTRTGLPVDFQVQLASAANERHGDGPRNPLGIPGAAARVFAGGGDATPEWGSP